jgi:hypothetical protein
VRLSVLAFSRFGHAFGSLLLLGAALQGQPVVLLNPSPQPNDQFGRTVAVLGTDRVLVSAHLDDTTGSDAGAAYLFQTNGTLLATFANPLPSTTDYFGYALAAVGVDFVVIGAYLEDQGVLDTGRAYLFDTNAQLVATFKNPTPGELDFFGFAVAGLGPDRVIVGEYRDSAGAKHSGAVHLFRLDGTLERTLVNPTPATSDSFGWSVAALGVDRVLVGAPLDDGVSVDMGAAHLFQADGALLTTFRSPRPRRGDQFGWSVAAVGDDRVLVGAPYDDTGNVDTGAAFLFKADGTLLASINNPRPKIADRFGDALAGVDGERLLIGCHLTDTVERDTGIAYLFGADGRLLQTLANPAQKFQDHFGISVAGLAGTHAVVGAHYGDTAGHNAGTVYLIPLVAE